MERKNVKLIINIPEKTIAHIRSDYVHGIKTLYPTDIGIVCDAIYSGVPCEDQKQGEWIDTGYGTSRCSVCGEKCQTYCMDKPRDRYCLWCGASMSANDRQVTGKLDENTQKHYGFRKKY